MNYVLKYRILTTEELKELEKDKAKQQPKRWRIPKVYSSSTFKYCMEYTGIRY